MSKNTKFRNDFNHSSHSRLYKAGLIAPRVRGMDHGAADRFAAEDLDALNFPGRRRPIFGGRSFVPHLPICLQRSEIQMV